MINNNLRRTLRCLLHWPGLCLLRKLISPLAKKYSKQKSGIIRDSIEGINFELDLGELIDRSLYWKGYFEYSTHKRICDILKLDWYVLDIGSNIGAHSLFMAKAVGEKGRVDAFEPAHYAYNKLKKNKNLNNLPQLHLHNLGFSNINQQKLKTSVFCSWPIDKSMTTPNTVGMPNVRAFEDEIQLLKFDDYIIRKEVEKIDFMKIDIDGNEMFFLDGGMETIERFCPIIILEAAAAPLKANGRSLNEYLDTLLSFKYKLYHEDTLDPLSEKTRQELNEIPNHSINLLAFQDNSKHNKILKTLQPIKIY